MTSFLMPRWLQRAVAWRVSGSPKPSFCSGADVVVPAPALAGPLARTGFLAANFSKLKDSESVRNLILPLLFIFASQRVISCYKFCMADKIYLQEKNEKKAKIIWQKIA
jgi:hypothetical protein